MLSEKALSAMMHQAPMQQFAILDCTWCGGLCLCGTGVETRKESGYGAKDWPSPLQKLLYWRGWTLCVYQRGTSARERVGSVEREDVG